MTRPDPTRDQTDTVLLGGVRAQVITEVLYKATQPHHSSAGTFPKLQGLGLGELISFSSSKEAYEGAHGASIGSSAPLSGSIDQPLPC